MLTVKENNGELKEILRFQKLARDDLKNNLDKKKMKTHTSGCSGNIHWRPACALCWVNSCFRHVL
jgi:hypothetical protein